MKQSIHSPICDVHVKEKNGFELVLYKNGRANSSIGPAKWSVGSSYNFL